MKAIRRFGNILAGSAPLLFLAQEAAASMSVGSITHAAVADVPALGGIGLLLLSGLLGVVSLRFLKAREKGRFMAIAVLAGALASAGGVNLVTNAEAGFGGIPLLLNDTVADIPSPGPSTVFNASGGSRQIIQIDLIDGCFLGDLENGGRNGGLMNGGGANGGMLINGGKNGGRFLGECNDDPGTRMQPDDFCEILVCCGGLNGGPNGGNGGCFEIE